MKKYMMIILVIFGDVFNDLFLIPGVRSAIFKNFPGEKSEKWPARQPASGTGPGSRVAGTGPG